MFEKLQSTIAAFLGRWKHTTSTETVPENVTPAPHTFTVDRTQWLRGEDPWFSKLLRTSDGKRDCLGFYLQSLGVADQDIADVGNPLSLGKEGLEKYGLQNSWLLFDPWRINTTCASDAVHNIIRCNDARFHTVMTKDDDGIAQAEDFPMTLEHRESTLKQLFAQNNIQVEFVN